MPDILYPSPVPIHISTSREGRSELLLAFLLPIALYGIAYRYAGFYYEDSTESILELMYRGFLIAQNGPNQVPFAYRFTGLLCERLYALMPSVPWFGLSLCTLSYAALVGYFILILRAVRGWRPAGRVALLVLFSWCFFLESILYVSVTRVAILLAGASMLLLFDALAEKVPRVAAVAPPLILLVLAYLTRSEAAVLGAFLGAPFMFCVRSKGSRRAALLTLAVPVVLVGVVGLYDKAEARYIAEMPYLGNLRDYDDPKPTRAPLSKDDRMRLAAAVEGMIFGDREVITPEFLSRISNRSAITLGKISTKRMAGALRALRSVVGLPYLLIAAANLGLLWVAWRQNTVGSRATTWRVAGFHAYFAVLMLSVAVFLKVVPRVVTPLVGLYACMCFLLGGELVATIRIGRRGRGLLVAGGLVIAVASAYVAFRNLDTLVSSCRNGRRANRKVLESVDRVTKGTVVVLPRPAFHALVLFDPLKGLPLRERERYLFMSAWPCLLRSYDRSVRQISESARLDHVFEALAERGAVFLSATSYNKLLKAHFRYFYGRRLSWLPQSGLMRTSSRWRVMLFRLEGVNAAEGMIGPVPQGRDNRDNPARH